MNYATGAAFNLDELLINFDMSKLKMTTKDAKKIANKADRKAAIKKVMRETLKLVLNDIIDNNVTLLLPTGGRPSSIHVKRTQGDAFINARKKGKWKDVDFLESNFSGNELVLEMNTGKTSIDKPIYVSKKLKNKLTANTNKGMQYC